MTIISAIFPSGLSNGLLPNNSFRRRQSTTKLPISLYVNSAYDLSL